MKPFAAIVSLFLVGVAVLVGPAQRPATPDEAARAAAVKLFASFSDEQKKAALLEYDNKDKYVEQFPAVERKGLAFDKLSAEQKAMVDDVIRAVTSPYGAERCLEVAKQTGPNRRYVTYYGDPKGPFAWRVAQHHLTLMYAEFSGDAKEFGPVLLGGNPVKSLWEAEEKLALAVFAALNAEEKKAIQGKGGNGSGQAIGTNGVKIESLNPQARDLAKQLLSKRLDVFSVDRRKALEKIIASDGGPDGLRIAFWGEATKGHLDGGNYHWRIGGPSVVCDWQTSGKNHLHMTVRGKLKS